MMHWCRTPVPYSNEARTLLFLMRSGLYESSIRTEARIGPAMQAVKRKVSVRAELIVRVQCVPLADWAWQLMGGRVDPKHFPLLCCGALW